MNVVELLNGDFALIANNGRIVFQKPTKGEVMDEFQRRNGFKWYGPPLVESDVKNQLSMKFTRKRKPRK